MENWVSVIKRALSGELPGRKSHLKMLPTGRAMVLPGDKTEVKKSGVLIVIFPEEDELYCCLIKRQSHLKNHAGQVGFPGGRMEKWDEDELKAAIREAEEEIGIVREKIVPLGALSPLYVAVSGFLLYPFVAWSPSMPEFALNHWEVKKLLLFPVLSYLRERRTSVQKVETVTGWLHAPGIPFKEEFIWGATAMILTEFFDVLECSLSKEHMP